MDAAWTGVAGTLFGALVGFLATTYTQRRASADARDTALAVLAQERADRELTLKYALAQELRGNVEILRLAVPDRHLTMQGHHPQLGRVQRVAWHAALGLSFGKLEVRDAVHQAYVAGAVLDVALDGVLGQTANTSAASWNHAIQQASAAFSAFEEAERLYRVNELPESKALGSYEYIL